MMICASLIAVGGLYYGLIKGSHQTGAELNHKIHRC